jgi:hypothetical protein
VVFNVIREGMVVVGIVSLQFFWAGAGVEEEQATGIALDQGERTRESH